MVILADGEVAPIDDSTIDFKVDGIAVTDKKREGKTLTLTYTPTGIQFPGESHTATLTCKTAGGFCRIETSGFKSLKNVILPTPLVTENFDSAPEGGQPAGWVPTNFTADCDVGVDFTDQKSSVYMNWAHHRREHGRARRRRSGPGECDGNGQWPTPDHRHASLRRRPIRGVREPPKGRRREWVTGWTRARWCGIEAEWVLGGPGPLLETPIRITIN
ncbi:MAG: hypothetical protein NT107_01370 [Planctomycetota bacterium]|nr:hypothetical protein [Planctomycetota bacterium]